MPPPLPRRAILEIRGGPLSSRKATLDPGATLRIGRTDRADLVVPQDSRLSAVHCAVSWDGARCTVRDLDSAGGTFLKGARVSEAEVQSGGWIKAGDTSVMVYIEASSPPVAVAEGPVEPRLLALARLRGLQRTGTLFAVVDASRGDRPLTLLREAVDQHRSLYDGIKGEALAHVAPYLAALRPDSDLLDRLVREGWGSRWAIYLYLSHPRPFLDVRRHLRRFLLVEDDETGKKYYFRFYDPFTLRVFLPTCTPRQRRDFFGEVACYLAEGEDGQLLSFPAEDT